MGGKTPSLLFFLKFLLRTRILRTQLHMYVQCEVASVGVVPSLGIARLDGVHVARCRWFGMSVA